MNLHLHMAGPVGKLVGDAEMREGSSGPPVGAIRLVFTNHKWEVSHTRGGPPNYKSEEEAEFISLRDRAGKSFQKNQNLD